MIDPLGHFLQTIKSKQSKVFVEAKRLDRDYDPDYKAQLDKYASYLDEGGIAVLTNGRFWLVHTVVNGDTDHLVTIDIAEGDAEIVAGKLDNVIGRDARSNYSPSRLTRKLSPKT